MEILLSEASTWEDFSPGQFHFVSFCFLEFFNLDKNLQPPSSMLILEKYVDSLREILIYQNIGAEIFKDKQTSWKQITSLQRLY